MMEAYSLETQLMRSKLTAEQYRDLRVEQMTKELCEGTITQDHYATIMNEWGVWDDRQREDQEDFDNKQWRTATTPFELQSYLRDRSSIKFPLNHLEIAIEDSGYRPHDIIQSPADMMAFWEIVQPWYDRWEEREWHDYDKGRKKMLKQVTDLCEQLIEREEAA